MGAPVPSASHKARTIISYFILYISTPEETLTRTTQPRRGRQWIKRRKRKQLGRKRKREREREKWKRKKKGTRGKRSIYREEKKKMVAGFSKSPCKVHFCRPEFLLTWLSFFVPFFFVFFFVLRFFSLRAAALFCDTSTFRKDSGQGWRVEVNSCDVLVKIQWNLLCRLSLYTWLVRGMKSRFLWESDF